MAKPQLNMYRCNCGANVLVDEFGPNCAFIGPLEHEQRHKTIGTAGCKGCASPDDVWQQYAARWHACSTWDEGESA